jgi:hypothetical protein
MSFQPVVPISGYAGWKFLERTSDTQRAAFAESRPIQTATDRFRDGIGSVTTAEQLVADRDLLRVALGAFGLDDDLNNRFFIRKILEGGTQDRDALANRLSDSRYAKLADAFGFGDVGPPRTRAPGFADEIIDRYESRQFERAVGESDNSMRLALNLEPALRDIVSANRSGDAQWFALMGNPPVRKVFETALGFPPSFGSIDIDQQLDQFKARSEAVLGTDRLDEVLSEDSRDKLIRLFMVRDATQSAVAPGGGSVALTLLQQAGPPTV